MNQTPKIILILSLIALLILSGCKTPTPETKDCTQISGQAKENCYYEAKQCTLMKDGDFKDSCQVQLAKDQNSSTACNSLSTEKGQGYCLEQLALQTKDKILCSNIKDQYWKDNCYFNLGIQENKEGLCYLINATTVKQKEDCFMKVALAKEKVSVCDFLIGEKRETCVYQVAIKTTEIESCSLLQSPIYKEGCKYKIAKLTEDETICDTIKIADIRGLCKDYFKGLKTTEAPAAPQ